MSHRVKRSCHPRSLHAASCHQTLSLTLNQPWAQILQARMAEGGLQIAPPIMANAYKSLSDGYQAFQGCRYVEAAFKLLYKSLSDGCQAF